MLRSVSVVAAAVLMVSGLADGAPRVRGATVAAHRNPIHVQGFYRVDPFTDVPGFYHQYPYTLFGYPNYKSSYFPLYLDYEYPKTNCDFVWGRPTARHKPTQRGRWTCS